MKGNRKAELISLAQRCGEAADSWSSSMNSSNLPGRVHPTPAVEVNPLALTEPTAMAAAGKKETRFLHLLRISHHDARRCRTASEIPSGPYSR